MSHILAILTAGRKEYLDITMGSISKYLNGSITEKVIFDNSDGPEITYEGYRTIKVPSFGLPYGYDRHARAMDYIFNTLKDIEQKYVVFFEEDWELKEEVNVDELSPYLTDDVGQIRLYRPQEYLEVIPLSKDVVEATVKAYTFTLNPSVFRTDIFKYSYPLDQGINHEYFFGEAVNKKILVYKYGQTVVEHIGEYSVEKPVRWTENYEWEKI
jgi:hypothetical protein